MTTDRTAPARHSAPPERSPAAGAKPAPPADAFSALLGSVASRPDEPPRSTPAPDRGHDAPQPDHAPRPGAEEPTGAPAAAAPAPVAPEAPAPPNPFTLQLAGPLPPAAPTTPVPAGEPAAPAATTLPAVAPATPPATGAVAASALPAAELPQPATAAKPQPLPVLGGLIPASALAAEPTPVPESPAAATQPAAPAADLTPDQLNAMLQNATAGRPRSDAQPQEQPAAAAPAPPAPAQAKPAEAPAASAAPTPTAPPAAAAPMPSTPLTPAPGLERAVPLYRAVETTRTLLHVAAERGVTHARLNLKPAELGGIEVRLQSTPQGVNAQLVADNAEAARMLTHASEDLRRQLAERDVTLLSLEVSTSSEQRQDAPAAGGFGAFADDPHAGPWFGPRGAGEHSADAAPAETTLVLPDGVLVDVLA